MDRFTKICEALEKCSTFADIGCDHGLYTEYMLKNGLCEKALISDISAASLKKAEILLSEYIAKGMVKSACADGLKATDKETSLVLIAGMGGMEIIKILSEGFIPKKFVFQPMKDSAELRRFLVRKGARITLDITFFDGEHFYDLIKGEGSGGDIYGPDEILFGRDNIRRPTPDFIKKLDCEIEKVSSYLASAKDWQNIRSLREKYDILIRTRQICIWQTT